VPILKDIKIFSSFGKAFIPKKIIPTISFQFEKAGYFEVPYTLFGIFFYLTLIITYFLYIPHFFNIVRHLHPLTFVFSTFVFWVICPIILSIIVMLITYFYLDVKIFNRVKLMESKLGDYFSVVSTNLKGGMSFENSLWEAIKPEFSVLAEEMGIVSKKVMTGTDLTKSLNELIKKYNSPIMTRSINLIISEIQSGGRISDLIDRVVNDLKKTRLLKQEMSASTLTYVIFISAIILFISPVLFALSYQLLDVMLGFMTRFAGLNVPNMPFSISGEATIEPMAFRRFSFFAITTISVFASMIITIIQRGDIKSGLKYIPVFWLVSILVYIIANNILTTIFSNLL
jgi:hypothetical protein